MRNSKNYNNITVVVRTYYTIIIYIRGIIRLLTGDFRRTIVTRDQNLRCEKC